MSSAIPPFIALANRCLLEPASRALDAAIHCEVHGIIDANPRTLAPLIERRARGLILFKPGGPWIEALPYTGDMTCAKSLLPDGLATIAREPRIVCAIALMARARLEVPTLDWSGWRMRWLG